MTRVNTAVFISGRGSNLESLLKSHQQDNYPAQIKLVVSNNQAAGGLVLAERAGIATAVFDNHSYMGERSIQEQHIHDCLIAHQIELIVLAGYMRVLSEDFVNQWHDRIINIHPSLLPKYPGLHTHQRVLDAQDIVHGCTVHWVTPVLDAGPCIIQAVVPVLSGDTSDSLAARVLEQEHLILPQALALAAQHIQNI
jgi:phosphoribosylglycinamide formyltransferase-1